MTTMRVITQPDGSSVHLCPLQMWTDEPSLCPPVSTCVHFALVKNPNDLTDGQRAKLDEVRKAGSHLFRAWELKEDLRAVFQASDAGEAASLLDEWLARASRCRIPQVVAVNRKVRRRRDDIIAAVDLGISNARVEAINNKIKVTVKMGYGFRNTDNLIGLLMLRRSDNNPQLPGRPAKEKKAKIRRAA